MAQNDPSRPGRNVLGRAWDESLDPRGRAFVAFALITLAFAAVFSAGGSVTPSGVGVSAYIAAVTTLLLARRGQFAERVTVFVDRDGERVPVRQKIRPVLKRDRVQPLAGPAVMTAHEALAQYPAATRVIGVSINGEDRAFPLAVLSFHEAVHDVVGGADVAVMWSPFCYTARVFRAPEADRQFRLGSTGRVVVNSPVMYDRDTGYRWLQYQGALLDGPDAGMRLGEIPSLNTTLAAWVAAYPDTGVASDPASPRVDLFDNYYAGGRAGMHRAPHRDPRWPPKEIVAGLDINGDHCAFPISWLDIEPVMNEYVGGLPIVAAYERPSATVAVFRADPGGRRLTFDAERQRDGPVDMDGATGEDEAADAPGTVGNVEAAYLPAMLVDRETGSRWRAVNGRCVQGELAGLTLERVAAGLTFWFAWSNFHPSTRLPPRPDLSVLAPGSGERV